MSLAPNLKFLSPNVNPGWDNVPYLDQTRPTLIFGPKMDQSILSGIYQSSSMLHTYNIQKPSPKLDMLFSSQQKRDRFAEPSLRFA